MKWTLINWSLVFMLATLLTFTSFLIAAFGKFAGTCIGCIALAATTMALAASAK